MIALAGAEVDVVAPVHVADDWCARHEAHFERTWLTYLLCHFGEWCRASDVWDAQDVHQRSVLRQRAYEAVQSARRLGLFIESDRRFGYRVTGHDDLVKYVHIKSADETSDHASDPCQLSIPDVPSG